MNDLDSDINSERAESLDASHESDCMYNNTCEDDNMSYSSGILSTEKEVIPSSSNNTNQQISKRKYLTKKKKIAVQSTKVLQSSPDPFYNYKPKVILGTQNAFDLMLKKKNKACEHNNKINISYSSNENFILPKQQDRIISDEITRQSSNTSTSEIIDNVRHGIYIIGMPNGKPCNDDPSAIEISISKPHNIVEQVICNHIVTKLIIAQNLPLSLVEKKVKNLIDDGFKRICTALYNNLQQANTVSLTADMWTAYSHNSYLGITVTWINKNIQDILEFWNLRNKVFLITTDSSTNIKLACSKLDVKWVPCSAHILNLIVQKGLLPAKYLITHMNCLIKFFITPKQGEHLEKVQRSHQISNNQEKLNEKNKGRVFLHAQTDVVTCWNSTYKAWSRMLELKLYIEILSSSLTIQPEANTIANRKRLKKIMITESKWAEVASIINILKPFDNVTNYISSSSYPTMSIIYPTIISLQNVLLKLFKNNDVSDFISHDEETVFDNKDLTNTDEELKELKSLANTINLTNTIKKTIAGLFEKYYKLSNDDLLFIVISINPRCKNIKLEETTLDIQDYLRLGYDQETINKTFEPLLNEVMLDMSQLFLSSIFTAQPNIGHRNE
ncbi:39805_t:CDS:2, partial [Gigaspora margarita]